MQATVLSVLVVALVATAGCLGNGATEPVEPANAEPGNVNEGKVSEGSPPTERPAEPSLAARASLHLRGDETLSPSPPDTEEHVSAGPPLNGPHVDSSEYPLWEGVIPEHMNLTGGEVKLTVYVTATSASLAARLLPIWEIPGLDVNVRVADRSYEASLAGPDVMLPGEVYALEAAFPSRNGEVEPGAPVSLRISPYYAHADGAAEFRFVMGPDHPAHVALGEA